MSFNDILKAMQDAWLFAWRPIALCLIAYLVARFFNRSKTDEIVSRIVSSTKAYGVRLDSLRHVLEPYGLNKLIPLVFLVLVVGFMFFLNGPLSAAVRRLPPHLSFRPGILLARTMTKDDLLLLMRKYPRENNFENAYYLALSDAEIDNTPNIAARNWDEVQLFLKFSLLYSLVIVVVNMRSGQPIARLLIRFAVLLLIAAILWVISLAGLLFEIERDYQYRWYLAKRALEEQAPDDLFAPASDGEEAIIDEVFLKIDRQERWWQYHFFDEYRFRFDWFRYTFFPSFAHTQILAAP